MMSGYGFATASFVLSVPVVFLTGRVDQEESTCETPWKPGPAKLNVCLIISVLRSK